jgi:hypothetical protein
MTDSRDYRHDAAVMLRAAMTALNELSAFYAVTALGSSAGDRVAAMQVTGISATVSQSAALLYLGDQMRANVEVTRALVDQQTLANVIAIANPFESVLVNREDEHAVEAYVRARIHDIVNPAAAGEPPQ